MLVDGEVPAQVIVAMDKCSKFSLVSSALFATGIALIATGCAHIGSAAGPPSLQDSDPPSRVARLSYIQGSVTVQPAGSDDWAPAVLNRPFTAGDQVWVAEGGRAELDLGSAAISLDSVTRLTVLDLDDEAAQWSLTDGIAIVHVRRLDEGETFEVDTPNAALTLLRSGEYRVEIRADENSTRLTVRRGAAEAAGVSQTFTVNALQLARIAGVDSTTYEITAAPSQDSFDDFCATREARWARAQARDYVSPDVIGYQDLDEFGSWHIEAAWGPVWAPRSVSVGWAPYRFGHWLWIEPWGWTWIDDAPWGFAPFHYGRWIFIDRWCWIPGPLAVRPVYAPALVVFAGGGRPGFDFFFWIGGGAGVAWFPLGPREIYVPPYRHSRRYIENVNFSNTVIANPREIHSVDVRRQKYMNRGVNGAMTAVPRDAFVGGRPISRSVVEVSPRQAAEARIAGSAAPVAPARESLAPARGSVPSPRPNREPRPVIVRRAPPPSPVPFEQKRPALDARPGKSPDRGSLDQLRQAQPQPQPQVRPSWPGVAPRQPIQRPPQPPPNKSDVRREQRNDANRSRSIQNEQRRAEQAPKTGKRPPGGGK
jgi:hypothetical protein